MSERVCPWWLGYLLINPARRLLQNPDRILQAYVKSGAVVLDVGCAMGFFTLPLARLVGERGRVIAIDLQERMIRSLERRARKAGLSAWIEARTCTSSSLGIDDLAGRIDFALAFAVLHEVQYMRAALVSIGRSLRPGGLLLIAEPKDHVSVEEFDRTTATACECGFDIVGSPTIRRSRSLLLSRRADPETNRG